MKTYTYPIPEGMTIVDNRAAYARKELIRRHKMPAKTREIATANRSERFTKGLKFIIQLRGRVVKARRELIAKRKEIGVGGWERSIMTTNLPLSTEDMAAKPSWATHYFKGEHDFTLFESVDQWQWFINGELLEVYPQECGMLPYSSKINGAGND